MPTTAEILGYLAFYCIKLSGFHWAFLGGLAAGFSGLHAVRHHDRENEARAVFFAFLTLLGFAPPAAWAMFNFFFAAQLERSIPALPLIVWGMAFAGSIAGTIWFQRRFAQVFDVIKNKFTLRTRLERSTKTDVRYINQVLPPVMMYDTEKCFNVSKGLFLGMGEKNNPLYFPPGQPWPHMAIIGGSGSGKGVAIQNIIAQGAAAKHVIIILDPKDDEWMPHAAKAAAEKAGVPYYFIDLNPEAPHQFNMFKGCSQHEANELMQAGFNLGAKGTDADHYRLADRQACRWLSKRMKPGDTAASLYEQFGAQLKKTATGLEGALLEMAEIPSVNAIDGIDLAKVIEEGGVLYVVGNMRDESVKTLQRMLVVRIIQLAERRNRMAAMRPVGLVMDEFIYHISRASLEALGAARDKGVYAVLAFQGISDLDRAPGDLSPEAVRGAIIESCKLKLVYGLEDPETAKWFAAMTGMILVDDEARKVEKDLVLVETMEGERTIRQTDRPLVDENMFTTLPKGLGVVIGMQRYVPGAKRAEFVSVCPIKVKKTAEAIAPQSWPGHALKEFDEDDLAPAPKKQGKPAAPAAEDSELAPLPPKKKQTSKAA